MIEEELDVQDEGSDHYYCSKKEFELNRMYTCSIKNI